MEHKRGQSGLSLTEMTVVVALVALLTTFSMPAIRSYFNSAASTGSVEAVISAALASGRAIAAREQRYAGVRFQQDSSGQQYMIFIVNDPRKTNMLASRFGFCAVDGLKPVKLPEDVGVMDSRLRAFYEPTQSAAENPLEQAFTIDHLDDLNVANLINEVGYEKINGRNKYIIDTTSFSIIFSPSGKLVIHGVRIRNRDKKPRPTVLSDSGDDIFNGYYNVYDNVAGMFVQDDYAEFGLGAEFSRNNFVIYDKARFDGMNKVERDVYLQSLNSIYINPYTGTIINR